MINDIIEKTKLHLNRAKSARSEIKNWPNGLDCELFEDSEKIKTIDTFIYRFIKLQDMMGDKLFKFFLDELGEYNDTMSLLDVLDKLEKFEIIEDASKWMEYRKIRNKLTHEYPNNEDEVIEGIHIAMDVFSDIEQILENIEHYVEKNIKNKNKGNL